MHKIFGNVSFSYSIIQFFSALADNKVSRIYLIPSLIKNMLEVMRETNQTLPDLIHWESTGEALTSDTANSFFQFFTDSTVIMIIVLEMQ